MKYLGNNTKYTIEEVANIFSEKGFTLMSKEYKNNGSKLQVQCPKNHIFYPRLRDFICKKSRCPKCCGRFTFQELSSMTAKRGYRLISIDTSKIKHPKMKLECLNGHLWEVSRSNYLASIGCPKCQGINVYTLENVISIFEKESYKLKSTEYINCMTPLSVICPKNHHYNVRLNDFLGKKSRCTECHLLINETKCRNILEKLLNRSFPKCRPAFLSKGNGHTLELDGFNEDLMLAFEYDGESHYHPIYGSNNLSKQQENDKLKDKLCAKENVTLIRIPYFVKNKHKFIKQELFTREIRWDKV